MPETSDETPLSDDEFKELHRILQQAALAAYPNPERKGCPGSEVLNEIAHTSWPAKHPGYDHVKHCSPCLREMLDMREQIILARIRRKHRMYWAGIAAAVILVLGIGLMLWRYLPERAQQLPAAVINFATSIQRGAGSEQQMPAGTIQTYPRKALQVTMSLPPGSEDGPYDFEIVSLDRRTPFIQSRSTAHIANGLTTITQKVDFSRLQPDLYIARVKHPPFGQQWREVLIRIE